MTHRAVEPSRLLATLLKVLSFASPQADMDRVRAFIADLVRPKLRADLFDEVSIDRQGNLFARRLGPSGTKPLLVYTYAATHPQENMADAYPARVLGDGAQARVRGRGTAEQRSGLAASLEAVNAFLEGVSQEHRSLRRGLDFVTNVAGEMGNHLVADELVRVHHCTPHAVVIAVASDNQLCLGNLGRVDVHVTIHGKPAHSSDPSRGVNALNGARLFLNRLAEVRLDRADAELGQASLAPVFLETFPRASHTIPARAAITLDRRLLPGEEIQDAIAQIEACTRDLHGCSAEVVAGHFNYPNKVSRDADIARQTTAAMREAGLPADVIYKRSALDGGYFTRSGAECVVFGPGDPRLGHSDEEWVLVRQVEQAADVYVRLFEKMCV